MPDINQLLNDITNAEITKKQLEVQLKIVSDEYTLECKELQRLNDKNVEYSSALKEQERVKQIKSDSEQRQQDKENLRDFINELGQSFKRWQYEILFTDNI